VWIKQPDRAKKVFVGTVAGTINGSGHRQIAIDGVKYYASSLVWLYVHGQWPENLMDHIDANPSNDRLANLRQATKQQNCANRGPQKNSTTGIKGVFFRDGRSCPWYAKICVNQKAIHLGSFLTKQEAATAYAKASTSAFGEFARAA
jgi:hypothetical protein